MHHRHHTCDQFAGVTDDAPPRLHQGAGTVGRVGAERRGEGRVDRLAVRGDLGGTTLQPGRQPATQIEQPRAHPEGPQRAEQVARGRDRGRPLRRVPLLGADVERHPGDIETETVGAQRDRDRLVDLAAVLPRQRPVRPFAGRAQPDQHLGARADGRQLGRLLGGVDDEQPHPQLEGGGQVPATSDRVRVHELVRVGAGLETGRHLGRAGDIEGAPRRRQPRQQRPMGVGLDGVVDGRRRKRPLHLSVAIDGGLDVEPQERCARRSHRSGNRARGGQQCVPHVRTRSPRPS